MSCLGKNCFRILLSVLILSAAVVQLHAEDSTPRENPSQPFIIRYPDIEHQYKPEFDNYFLDILSLAMERSGVDYQLVPVARPPAPESRSGRNLQNRYYTVHWLNSTPDRETELLAIKIPLMKGLIGWRLLLIRRDDQALFEEVKNANDLRHFSVGLGHDWPDIAIYKQNDINVVAAGSWEGLYRMVPAGRVDFLSRSIIEIEEELRTFPDMYMEQHLVLQYPAAYYFFVSKENRALARILEDALLRIIDNGEFDQVFNRYFAAAIEKADLPRRRIIRLNNDQAFPLHNAKLWYRLADRPEGVVGRPPPE